LSRLAGPLQRASEAGGRFASSNQSGEATRAGVPEGEVCAPPAKSTKVSVTTSREPFEGCSSRKSRSEEATRKSAAIGKKRCGDASLSFLPNHDYIPRREEVAVEDFFRRRVAAQYLDHLSSSRINPRAVKLRRRKAARSSCHCFCRPRRKPRDPDRSIRRRR